MDDREEKRMAGSYEITESIAVGDREVVFGMDDKAGMPFFCAFCERNGFLLSYEECVAGDDYVEIVELFADRVKEQCVRFREQQAKATVPKERITAEMCIPIGSCEDIVGKVAAIKAEALRPEYRFAEHQLVYVKGGNGSRSRAAGRACYCNTLYSGEYERWERYDLEGLVKPECLPEWARERFAEIQKQETVKTVSEQNMKNQEKER